MHQHDGFLGQQVTDVGIVVAPRLGMQQMQNRSIGLPARHRLQAVNAAPRPRHHHNRFPRGADQRVQRRIIAARQPQPRTARQPPPRPQRTSLRDPSPRTVASRDHARAPKLTVRARHRAGRTPQLRRQRPGRRQRRTRRPPPIRDLQGQRLRQILHHLHQYRYHDRERCQPGRSVVAREAANERRRPRPGRFAEAVETPFRRSPSGSAAIAGCAACRRTATLRARPVAAAWRRWRMRSPTGLLLGGLRARPGGGRRRISADA